MTRKRNRKVKKEEYFSYLYLKTPDEVTPHRLCYCCQFDSDCAYYRAESKCRNCPINWGSERHNFKCIDKYRNEDYLSLYGKWELTKNWRTAAKLAKQIAELSERDL